MDTQLIQPTVWDRVTAAFTSARDWLDERGKAAWLIAMILGFIFVWPVGLGILAYMIWSKRMFGCRYHRNRRDNGVDAQAFAPTGNAAFDAYRAETLKRLEDEHREFLDFLQKLREARDKAEFDQFMQQRGTEG
ncbi:MAG: DUF2852 domain-containing protein [Burkholderiaceae bacterium]|nr:DUF2852 domain-containing protein [Burkholderiaceae bacterium]